MRPAPASAWFVALAATVLGAPAWAGDLPKELAGYERAFTAEEREHWAFQAVRRPELPSLEHPSWVRTPIDAFVLAKLEAAGLVPAPPADRRTLLRRVYLDLLGIPPTPDEQRAFLADESPLAFEEVVDDLLARPEYGERWARHWLDVVRYAESNGYERDGAKPSAWRYRDYVIQSLNQDKPYDRFLTEQLAGDEIDGSNAESQVATTFLRLGTWDDEPAEPVVDRYDQLDDVLGTSASAFLGITLRCARCHYHKFEPFSQVDYYRMLAVFEPLKRPQDGRTDLDRPVGTQGELAAYRAGTQKADQDLAPLDARLGKLKEAIRDRLFTSALASSKPDAAMPPVAGTPSGDAHAKAQRASLPAEAIAAFRADPSTRTAEQKQLVKKFAEQLEQEIRDAATADERSEREDLERRIAQINAGRPKDAPRAYIWYEDGPNGPASQVLRRGDPHSPVADVAPGLPGILVRQQPDAPRPTEQSTGRRLWLARWMTSPENPLVARVWVNRVWQHHFADGLVATENDFGRMGDPPSHPELLDWLASELVAGGWRTKPLHRMIVLSNTYRQAAVAPGNLAAGLAPGPSTGSAHGEDLDPDNRLLWHWPQRRLEAEAVRDSVLAVSGQLNAAMGGPSMYPVVPRAVLEGQSRPGEGWGKSDERETARRSVYIFVKRVLAVPELELLDAPDTTSSCERRTSSTIAPQALTFLNGDFMNQQARSFAERLRREAGQDPAAQVRRGFELALCRPPRSDELHAASDFLSAQAAGIAADARAAGQDSGDVTGRALAAFCLVLLNTNEFVYMD